VKNISNKRTLTTRELESLKTIVHNRVENWIKIKLRLNALITETLGIYKQVGVPVKAVNRVLLECLKESFDETIKQTKKKLKDLK